MMRLYTVDDADAIRHERLRADRLEARVAALTDTLLSMQRDGFKAVPQPVAPEPEPELPSVVMDAIIDRSGGDLSSKLGRQLVETARQRLGKHSADDVAALIWDGEP